MNAYEILADRALARAVCAELDGDVFTKEQSSFGGLSLPFGLTVVWGGDVTNYLNATNDQINTVSADIAKTLLPDDFMTSWASFLTQWQTYYNSEINSTHILGAADSMNMIDTYVQRLKGYQDKMKELGAAKNTPEIVQDPGSQYNPNKGQPGFGTLEAIGVGAAGILVILVGVKVLKTTLVPHF
jgi:hypothetical protein